MTNRELIKQKIDHLNDLDIQKISQFIEFLQFCHQKEQQSQPVTEDPLIGLFAGSSELATQSETILQQDVRPYSGWTWKPSSQTQALLIPSVT